MVPWVAAGGPGSGSVTTFPYTPVAPVWSQVVKVRPVERGARKPSTPPPATFPSCADWVWTLRPRNHLGKSLCQSFCEPEFLLSYLARKIRPPAPMVIRSY